jgi:hypothetical protein
MATTPLDLRGGRARRRPRFELTEGRWLGPALLVSLGLWVAIGLVIALLVRVL